MNINIVIIEFVQNLLKNTNKRAVNSIVISIDENPIITEVTEICKQKKNITKKGKSSLQILI